MAAEAGTVQKKRLCLLRKLQSMANGPVLASEKGSTIRVILKNQDRFDEEASFSAPLLDMGKEWLYRAWREQYAEMLGRWGLVSARAEVLKFNGLISYFPPDVDKSGGGSKANSVHLGFKGNDREKVSVNLFSHLLSLSFTAY